MIFCYHRIPKLIKYSLINILLLLSHFSRVQLCVTPKMAAHQAPLSLGFSRQKHWSGCHFILQCMKVESEREVAQLCLTLSDPVDYSLPGSSVHGIFQARVLEWVAIASYLRLICKFLFLIAWCSNSWFHACMVSHFSRVWLFVTLWTIAHQAPLSTGFSRQEYWSGFPYPPPGHFPDPGIKPLSLSSPALAGESFATSATWKAKFLIT